ncbi:MAG: ComF family protein, partial [Polaribacter sp.]
KNSSSEFLNIDLIVPIPLHPKKMKSRGYNQCHSFTLKLSEEINKPVDLENVIRKVDTISQTGKNRIKRWENVSQIFEVTNKSLFKGKHILIVDDVITTGATIEALAVKILEIENTTVSVLTLASAI